MSNIVFLISYLVVMTLTYFWRVAVFGAVEDPTVAMSMSDAESIVVWLMLISYAIMVLIAYKRGKSIGKGYLAAFPLVGCVFDLVIPFVPFVPTVMNIITIILGMPNLQARTAPKANFRAQPLRPVAVVKKEEAPAAASKAVAAPKKAAPKKAVKKPAAKKAALKKAAPKKAALKKPAKKAAKRK